MMIVGIVVQLIVLYWIQIDTSKHLAFKHPRGIPTDIPKLGTAVDAVVRQGPTGSILASNAAPWETVGTLPVVVGIAPLAGVQS